MEYLKKALLSTEDDSQEAREIARRTLDMIKTEGEAAVRRLAQTYDTWEGDFILSQEKKAKLMASVPESVKRDIAFAHKQIFTFAKAQRESLRDFELEVTPGVRLGQKTLPVGVAGCYVPGGRFAHACSALMSVATARAAGVPFVIAASPPRGGHIDPAVCYAMDLAGADIILEMGGIQAIGTMAYGLFTGKPANILVGPGNAYVAEAKALLCGSGQCGIDVFAGPTESAVIADASADPMTVAIDLVSQAEHGLNSPVWLFTTSREVGQKVLELIPLLCADMPNPEVPATAWRDYGEVIYCESREELADVSNVYAAEHVQVITEDLDWWLQHLNAYGSLFLGEGSTVPHGDKCSGTNHILPTRRAGHFSGGLNAQKFLKICTYQHISKEGNKIIGPVASRLSRVEGMEGHARACDWRLTRYYPEEAWDFHVYQHPKHTEGAC